MYALVSSLIGTIQSNPLPECDRFDTLAENFADFFHTKIKKIRDNLDHFPKYIPQHKDIPILDRFHPMISHEVLQIITNIFTKQCELDQIPTSLFKQLVPHITDNITTIVNISLTRGNFTEEWKTAHNKPVIEKITMELVSISYRPVSNLKFLSRMVECCMLSEFNEHCTLHSLLLSYQSAYRAKHICETLLLKLCNDALWRMESKEDNAFVIMDLSSVFDTVDHDILLTGLCNHSSITINAPSWFDTTST